MHGFGRGAAALAMLAGAMLPQPARADNAMGYTLMSQQEAASLPRNRGGLGLEVERTQQINEPGMTFDLIRVKQVHQGSAGAQAGFRVGDQIIAVNGRVFPSIQAFANYIGSLTPGAQASVDYIPNGGGPGQAQRITVAIGEAGRAAANGGGLSTGTKVAIGVGAAALLGCYELGCFSHRNTQKQAPQQQPAQPQGQFTPAQ